VRALKLPYENELYELRKWIDFTNANLHMQFLHTPQEIQRVYQWINAITRGIQADYPFYATTLPCVANILFQQNEVECDFLPAVIVFQVVALGFRADELAALGHNQNIRVMLDKAVD